MRNLYLIPLLALALIACENPAGGALHNKTETARVTIKLPGREDSRTLEPGVARNNANYYEVIFRGGQAGNYTYKTAEAGEGATEITVNLNVGTYDILLLAGRYEEELASYPMLLASASKTGQTITAEGPNQVDLTLKTVDITLDCEDTAVIDEPFNVGITIDIDNPFIAQPIGSSIYLEHNFSGNDFITVSGGTYSLITNAITYTISAPETAGDREVRLDAGSSIYPFSNYDLQGWCYAEYDVYHNSPLESNFQKTITIALD